MSRLIDADALCVKIEDNLVSLSTCISIDWYMGKSQMKKDVLENIKNAPTIEAEPVRRGKWISQEEYFDEYFECSVCGAGFCTLDGLSPEENNMKYCPECGAKMDSEVE